MRCFCSLFEISSFEVFPPYFAVWEVHQISSIFIVFLSILNPFNYATRYKELRHDSDRGFISSLQNDASSSIHHDAFRIVISSLRNGCYIIAPPAPAERDQKWGM